MLLDLQPGSFRPHGWTLLFVVLWTFNGVQTTDCGIDVYVSLNDTDNAASNEDEVYYVVKDCTVTVNNNGYLLLNGTNQTFPILPSSADPITIKWKTTDPNASYEINVRDSSMMEAFQSINIIEPTSGFITALSNGITVNFPCTDTSNVIGILNITILINSSLLTNTSLLTAHFLLKKDCRGSSQSASGPLVPMFTSDEGSGTDETLSPFYSSSTVSRPNPSLSPSNSQSSFSLPSDSFQSSQFSSPSIHIPVITTTTVDTPTRETTPPPLFTSILTSVPSTVLPGSEDDGNLQWLLFTIVLSPIVCFLILCILIVTCCLCLVCCVCRSKKSQVPTAGFYDNPNEIVHRAYDDVLLEIEEEKDKKETAPVYLWSTLPWGLVVMLPLHIQKMIKTVNIDRRKLTITNTFLRVENGCLNHGLLLMDSSNPMSVLNQGTMLKMMTSFGENCHRDEVLKFIDQALSLQGLEHVNILPLLGMSIEDNLVPIIIYPIIEYGNLHSFLELCRVSPESCPLNPFGEEYMANFGLQLVAALRFLHEKGLTHQDIALRNCWLDNGYIVKLSDGALSQEFHPDSYSTIKGALRPTKWSALETLQEGLLTSQSNIWSFGITLWEIFSMAETPYKDVPNGSIISHLMMDERLPRPEGCKNEIYELMTQCWNVRAEERPSVTTLENRLIDISTRLPSLVFPKGTFPFSPKSNDLAYSTFLPTDTRKPMSTVIEEPYINHCEGVQLTSRHSGTSMLSDAILRRSSCGKKRRSGHLSGKSAGSGGDHLSLSFSVLSGNDDSSSSTASSDNEGEGSFPSTLKSTKSTITGTLPPPDGGQPSEVGGAGSILTLQQPSPLEMYPPAETSDVSSKTSTMDDSVSARSSVLLQPTNQSISGGTDRSSFYSTGIDSVSTTFSTPLPNSASTNNTPSIELKTYSSNDDPHGPGMAGRSTRPIETNSTSPFTGKSTDSGIRSDEENSNFSVSITPLPKPTEPSVVLRKPPPPPPSNAAINNHLQPSEANKTNLRDSSQLSRTSFGLGLSDMSTDLMTAFQQFSFN